MIYWVGIAFLGGLLVGAVLIASDLLGVEATIDAAFTGVQRTILEKLAAAQCRLAIELLRRNYL